MIGIGIGSNKPESTSSQGPPIPTNPSNLITEDGNQLITEDTNNLITE